MDETAALARFAAELPASSIPKDVRHASSRCLLDYLGIGIAAHSEPAVRIATEVARIGGGKPQASLLGGGRISLVEAATVNGVAAHVLDFDDTHEPTILHGTTPVMSAALAAAEWVGASGVDLLAAHAVGFDVAARVALAVNPEHYDQGFHVTGTAGAIGAAAAAGRLLRLDAEQMAHALSTAAAQAAGLREMFGSMTKSLHAGKAAANGLYSALLAQRGWISAPAGLEGRRGYWAVLSSRSDPTIATVALGEDWELRRNGLKPYACGVVSHPTIDAVIGLARVSGLPSNQVAEIRARVNPYVLELMGKREPCSGLEGKFSIFHCAAIGYVDGSARVRQFSAAAVLRPEVVALRRLVRIETDAGLPTSSAAVELVAADGRCWHEYVAAASGTPGNPLTDEQVLAKYIDLVEDVLPRASARRLAELALGIEEVSDVREITERFQVTASL
ncbi:MAG: 2-methylcitrate dehydratase PrpD [Chloroflexi bacterium]|nr:2-methylcitrate dehydratase PrpD [Chloroflexota bacterium]